MSHDDAAMMQPSGSLNRSAPTEKAATTVMLPSDSVHIGNE